MTASGIIDDNGNITPVGSLARKIMAAKEAGLTTFLLSIDQKLEAGEQVNTNGIQVIPVANLMQAFCIASGQAPWQVIVAAK